MFLFPTSYLLQWAFLEETQPHQLNEDELFLYLFAQKKVLRMGYITENTVLTVHQLLVPKISVP